MPRSQFIDRDLVILRQPGVHVVLGLGERLAGQLVQLVEQLDQLLAVLLVEVQLQGMVVLEAELLRRLVRRPTSSLRFFSSTPPTALLASHTSCRRFESFDSFSTLRTSLSVISRPSTLARNSLNAFSTALDSLFIFWRMAGSTCFSR